MGSSAQVEGLALFWTFHTQDRDKVCEYKGKAVRRHAHRNLWVFFSDQLLCLARERIRLHSRSCIWEKVKEIADLLKALMPLRLIGPL